MPPFLFCSTAQDEQFARGIVSAGNDELATYAADAPQRLVALGSVALGFPGVADEARRCLDDLGMAGIAIGTRGAGRDLDDPINADLWELLSARGTFVFMHPSGVPDPHRQADFWMPQLVGYPMETALAVARLTFGQVLERTPLNLCLAHGGGCLPALRGRMDMGWERKDVAHTTTVPPSEFTDRLYYDTAVFSTRQLRRLVEDYGADHVLLGTDHPFELGDRDPLGTVAALGLPAAESDAILWKSASALLGLHVHT
jgi:aminocarboxymuconate-semialdehyde decarboxylase